MGLNDLDGMDTPDNKGGRPSKTEKQSRESRFDGDALTVEKDHEDWWRHKFNRFKEEYDDMDEAIPALADHVAVFPREVRVKLEDYGIYETDWEAYIEKYPDMKRDTVIKDKLIEAGIDVPDADSSSGVSPELNSMFGGSSTGTTNDDEDGPSEGLQSLMD